MAANQGSRAGLITSVVILAIVSVVATIFAFWFGAEKRKSDELLGNLKIRYTDVISDTAILGPDVLEIKAMRTDAESGYTPQTKIWDVMVDQRNRLVKVVTGRDAGAGNTSAAAIKSAASALTSASETIKPANASLTSTNDDLLGAVNVLADKVKVQAQTISDRDTKLKDAETRALSAISQAGKDLAARDEQIAAIRLETNKSITASTEDRGNQQTTVAAIEKDRETDRAAQAEQLAKKEVELAARTNEVKRLEERLRNTQNRFDRIRVGVTDPIVRAADGVISGFSGPDIVYINLGQGKQIMTGLTFEVYDKSRGIPKINDPLEQEQPAGKATIEVMRVLPDASECRIVRREKGTQIMQGDPILNIVFDPNIKYNFVVFGLFDLDRNGIATAGDAQIVRRIVTQWGGKTSDKIGVDTDFLVIGAEPVTPSFSAEELADPVNIKKQEDAKSDLANYQDVIAQAKELHIPILNQNRFLHFTGQAGAVLR